MSGRRDHAGFTLIEMLVALSVLVILLMLAAPAFREFTAQQAVKNTAQSLYATLVFARSEALKRNADVWVVPNGGQADDWSDGWLVTTNAAQDSIDCDASATDADILRVACDVLDAETTLAGGQPDQVVYAGNGRSDPAEFVICRPGADARTVRVSLGGSAAIQQAGSCP